MQQSSSDGSDSESGWPSAEGVLVAAGSIGSGGEGDSGEAPAAQPGATIDLALPPQDGMQDRETRPGQTGSASEANNEAPSNDIAYAAAETTPETGTTDGTVPIETAEAFDPEGNNLSDGSRISVRREGNYRANTPGNSAPANYTNGDSTAGTQAGGASEPTPGTAPGYDADGNLLPGADGRVSMDDWIRLNDRDGDGQVDQNYVDLSGTEDTADGGEPTGAPAGAVGNGIPVPSVDLAGVPLEERIPGGGPFANGGAESPFEGRPVLDDIRPGLRGRVPDVPYEQDGTGVPGGSERPNGLDTLAPGIGELLDRDGDGRPDATLPGTEAPGFSPPGRGPGLTIPEDLGPREPGPEYEPGVDIAPPPRDGGAYTPPPEAPPGNGTGYPPPVAEPPTGRHGDYPPSNPEPPYAGVGPAPVEPPTAGDASPGTSAPTAGESLDVFLTPPAGSETSPEEPAALEPPDAVVVLEPTTVSPEPAEPSWTLTASPAIAQFDTGPAPATDAGLFEPVTGPGAISPELAAIIESVRAAADAATAPFQGGPKRDPDDPNVLERLLDLVRDALFMGDNQPSDEELASQIAALEPSTLVELERYAREHQIAGLAESDDDLDTDG